MIGINTCGLVMLTRRIFLKMCLAHLAICGGSAFAGTAGSYSFTGDAVFQRILSKAKSQCWSALPIGVLVGKIGTEFRGTPYRAGVLEVDKNREVCSANMCAVDCVTFVETALAFARMLKKGGGNQSDFLDELKFIRYRDGHLGDYTSRLHYSSDWFINNEKKNVFKILSDLQGSKAFVPNVYFMSKHPEAYPQLMGHPELVEKIKSQENELHGRSISFVPLGKIRGVERLLQTGDIIGICTSAAGLDVAHMGMIVRDRGTAKLMHASSKKMKVVLEAEPLHQVLKKPTYTGIIIARPLEINGKSTD